MNPTTANEAELLAAMAAQDVRREEARQAWGELYVRHRRYVHAFASRAYGSFLGEDGTIDLVVDTFRRAYEWAGKQKDPDELRAQFSGSDPDSTRRRVLGWLGAIAERLFKDRFAERASAAADFAEFLEDWRTAESRASEQSNATAAPRLEAALATLTAADLDALRVSLPWYDPDSQSFALPRGEAARLAVLIGITPETLRQRRHRAIKKLEQYLQTAESVDPTQGARR